MKALFIPRFAKQNITLVILVTLMFWIYPELSLGASLQSAGQDKLLVFEVKNPNTQTQENQIPSISFDTVVKNDPLVSRLHDYLEQKDSPLADDAAYIVTRPHWQRALAISFVESNMCRFTPKYTWHGKIAESHNCSGIGGDNFKRYDSYQGWFDDMTTLLGQPNYVNRPIEKFIGYYVVPGSSNWLYGVKMVESDLAVIQSQAQVDRFAQTAPVDHTVVASALDISAPIKLK